jgi:transcriptional regulator with XRE-family HTH domain
MIQEPTFAERLTKARKAAGLTQEAMAQKLQIPKRTIEDWSTGKSSPPIWTQPLILRELERIAAEN